MRRRSINVFGNHLGRKYNGVAEIAGRISPVNPQAFPKRMQLAWCFLCKHGRWRLFRHPCPYCEAGTNVLFMGSTSIGLRLRDNISGRAGGLHFGQISSVAVRTLFLQ